MAVTGTGTQADPFVVHSYSEFISLSGHAPISDTKAVYIKWFDEPGQVLDCNEYGSEFKWGSFAAISGYGGYTIYVDLNGSTIKNLIVADGVEMFTGTSWGGENMVVNVSNGAIRNVFMGSSTSKICNTYVDFHDISMSINVAGSTVSPFNGDWSHNINIDNCALYLVASTLTAPLMSQVRITDTDIELQISNQNGVVPFTGDMNAMEPWSMLKDCRIQGKIGGSPIAMTESGKCSVFGCATSEYSGDNGKVVKLTNCVVDVDLTDSYFDSYGANYSIYEANSSELNTNIFCNSHYPSQGQETGYTYPSDWNYISHSLMRNGAYLNAQGFTVVEVVEG